jgi:hypothetical protein
MKTEDDQHVGVVKQDTASPPVTISTGATRYALTRELLRDQYEKRADATARRAAVRAGRKQLEKANREYERCFEQNMLEMEFGPSCTCSKYAWQHELHPSGTATRDRERKREDDKMKDLEGEEV